MALVTVSQFLGPMCTVWGRIALLVPLCLKVTRLSFRHLSHLCRQVGFVQAHMGMGGSVTLRPEEEIPQLSIHFTCALEHFGHVGFGIGLPFLPGVAHISSVWLSEGSAEEPQQNRRKYEGDLRQCEEDVSYRGITILLTMTPEAHDGLLD